MRHLTILAAIVVAFMCGQAFESRNTNQPGAFYCADNTLPEGYDFSGIDLMENFVLDIVDETDFWYECDSTAFSEYAENSPEWYFAVCIEYTKWNERGGAR